MERTIISKIADAINGAAQFVVQRYPVNLTPDEVYEDLVRETHVLRTFQEAAKYLKPASFVGAVDVDFVGKTVESKRLMLRLPISEMRRVYLMPHYALAVNSESKLFKALTPVFAIAQEWDDLLYVFEQFSENKWTEGVDFMLFAMPWLANVARDAALDFTSTTNRSLRAKLTREYAKLCRGEPKLSSSMPRLNRMVNRTCLSGNKLFAQYRMLKSAGHHDDDKAIVSVIRERRTSDDLRAAVFDVFNSGSDANGY